MQRNFFTIKIVISILALSLTVNNAQAHSRWILPSHSILSGENPEIINVDISISNELFNPDHAVGGTTIESLGEASTKRKPSPPPLQALLNSTKLEVYKPSGKTKKDYTLVDFHRKSVAAIRLDENGSYRISLQQDPVYFTWFVLPDGNHDRRFGKAEQLKGHLPDNITEVQTTKLINRVETYVTRNDLSLSSIKPRGRGLELSFTTHPNELFVGEKARFTLLFNGKPLSSANNLSLTQYNTRSRNNRNTQKLKTNEKGAFEVKWLNAGFYLLEADIEQDSEEGGIAAEVHALFVSLEVFPE